MQGENIFFPSDDTVDVPPLMEASKVPNIFFSDDLGLSEKTRKPESEAPKIPCSFVEPAQEAPKWLAPIEEKREDNDIQQALSIADRFLKKLRTPAAATTFTASSAEQKGTIQRPFLLDLMDQPMPRFEFIHTGNIKAKGPTFIIHNLLRRIMDKEDMYINWAKMECIDSVKRFVVLVLADINGIELYERIMDGRLSSLKNVNNLEHSVVFDLPKQDEKIKFWSKIFDCPRVDNQAVLPPNTFKGEEYLLSPEDLKLLDFPSELNKESTFYTQTDLWPPVPKTEFNRILSLDCEMVITRVGYQIARITLVDEGFQVLYDTLVLPNDEVIDWISE